MPRAFADVSRTWCISTLTFGLMAFSRSLADSTFGLPIPAVSCRICLCRLLASTSSPVDDAEGADAGGGEIHGGRRPEAAGADAHHPRGLEPPLPVDADVGQDDVPGVAGQFLAA